MKFIKFSREGEMPGLFWLYLVIYIAIASLIVINFEVDFIWLRNFAFRLRSQSFASQVSQTLRVGQIMENNANGTINSLEHLARLIRRSGADRQAAASDIQTFLKENNNIRELSLINQEGKEFERYSRSRSYSARDLRDFAFLETFEAAKNGQVFLSKVEYTEFAEPYVNISMPVRSVSGQVESVLFAQYFLRGVWEIALETRIGDTGRIQVIDDKGMLIADPRPARVMKKLNLLKVPPAKTVLAGEIYQGSKYLNENGREVVGTGVPIRFHNQKWGVIVEQDSTEVETNIAEIYKWLLIILAGNLVIIGILVILSWFLRQANKELVKRYYLSESERSELEKEKNKTSAIISNFVDPIIVTDSDWRLLLWNPEAERVLGLRQDMAGTALPVKGDKFLLADLRSVLKIDYTSRIIESNGPGNLLVEEMKLGGNEEAEVRESVFNAAAEKNRIQGAVYKVISAPVNDSQGGNLGHMKIFYDMTREKIVDKLKSEFISIAAHQLRTPLASVKWIFKMLLDGDAGAVNAEQKDLLDRGYVSNERVIRLVNDLLNVTRIEEGKYGFEFSPVDFSSVLQAVLANTEKAVAENRIILDINRPEIWPVMQLDQEKIVIALTSILDNAIKYSLKGSKIKVSINVAGEFLEFVAEDQGVGIPESDQARLFTKFYRGANVVRMQTEGNGLGLFIVKNIIDQHNGTIAIESRESKGTRVRVLLPLGIPPNNK